MEAKSPFKFLDAYTANDTDIFVGREIEEKKLFQQLRNTTLNLLYGMSGTGKTSLAQCGLAKFYDGADWHPFYIRRGNNINESLLKALKDTLIDIEDAAILDAYKLPELVYQVFITFSRPVYLIFDQFEELFTIASNNKEERESFFKTIQELQKQNLPCKIIIIIREEFLGELYEYEKFVPNLFDFRLRIEPMTVAKLKQVTTHTLDSFDVKVSQDNLIDTITQNLLDGKISSQLAFLQVYLDRLWQEAEYDNQQVTISDATVSKVGKIEAVLEKFLDNQLASIADKNEYKQKQLRLLLDRFVTEDGTKRPIAEDNLTAFEKMLVQQLESVRIIRKNEIYYELIHDSIAIIIKDKLNVERHRYSGILKILYLGHLFHNEERGDLIRDLQIDRLIASDSGLYLFENKIEFSNSIWQMFDLGIKLRKPSYSIGNTQRFIRNKMIKFEAHSSVSADVNLIPLTAHGTYGIKLIYNYLFGSDFQSIHSIKLLDNTLAGKHIELFPLIELESIKGTVSIDNPLILKIQNQAIDSNEIVIPVMVNGEDVIVIGTSKTLPNKGSEIYIEQFPESYGDNKKRQNAAAFKFCLMKLIFKTIPDNYFALNWVDYEQAKPVRKNLNLSQKITKAKNIVLLIHGIIGDTEGMIPFAQRLVKPTEDSKAKYDLVLTFDYECLNTPIEKIAENLAIILSEHGIDGNTDKKLTIVAHSMGGLVSRVLIEKLGKASLVKKLIMAGTPNGGTELDSASAYIYLANYVLTLGLSSALVAPYLAWAGGLIVALKKSSMLTVTLEQMKRNSDFINSLYIQNDPHVPYYILAGNIDLYQPNREEEDTWFEKLSMNLVLGVGNLFHEGKQHDIAVYTKDIMKVNSNRQPQVTFQEVGCPHIFYFDEPQSKEILYQWLEV